MNKGSKKTEQSIPSVVISTCKYGMNDCLNRQIMCKKCVNMSKYEWDYIDKY